MKPRSTTSEEPAIAVSAAAMRPPVQDSAVATCQPRARQAASTASASDRVSGSNTENSFADQQDQHSVERRHNIVEHDPEAAGDTTLDGPDRPGLDNVEQPEQQERGGIPAPVEGYRNQHQPLRRNLVDDDEARVGEPARRDDPARCPAAEHEGNGSRGEKREVADVSGDKPAGE